MPTWITSPIFALLALVFFVGFAVQTVRVDGFPLLHTGLRTQLAECEAANGEAAKAEQVQVDRIRAEGKVAADADTARLRKEAETRETDLTGQLSDLQKIVTRLRVRPPTPSPVPGQPVPPVVALQPLPPLPAACGLDRGALDDLRASLNRGRVP